MSFRPPTFAGVNKGSPQFKNLVHWWPVTELDVFAAGTARTTAILDVVGGLHAQNNGAAFENKPSPNGYVLANTTGAANNGGSTLTLDTAKFSGEATLSMWVKLNAATPGVSGDSGLARFDNCDTATHYPFTDGLIYCGVFRGSGNRVSGITPLAHVDRAQPHLVTVTCDSVTWNLYQNGQLTHSTTATPTLALSAQAGFHGNTSVFGHNLAGQSWDWRLYNRALSAAEVYALYAPATRHNLYAKPQKRKVYKLASAPAGPTHNNRIYIFT